MSRTPRALTPAAATTITSTPSLSPAPHRAPSRTQVLGKQLADCQSRLQAREAKIARMIVELREMRDYVENETIIKEGEIAECIDQTIIFMDKEAEFKAAAKDFEETIVVYEEEKHELKREVRRLKRKMERRSVMRAEMRALRAENAALRVGAEGVQAAWGKLEGLASVLVKVPQSERVSVLTKFMLRRPSEQGPMDSGLRGIEVSVNEHAVKLMTEDGTGRLWSTAEIKVLETTEVDMVEGEVRRIE